MLLLTHTGSATSTKEIVETDLMGLRISIAGDSNLQETIYIRKQNKKGHTIYSNSLSILDLVRLSDDGEGANFILQHGTPSSRKYELFIKLSEEGNISTSSDERWEIQLGSCVSAATYKVYSAQGILDSDGEIIYSKYENQGTKNRLEIDVAKYSSCIMSNEDLDSLELVYSNGKTIILDAEEVAMLSNHVTDMVLKGSDENLVSQDVDRFYADPTLKAKLPLTGVSKIYFTGELTYGITFEEWKEASVISA
jgi:hypothetical protein